jgi:hypothetical protein
VNGETNLVGVKLGNYLLQRVIGRGHTGVVYLAIDEALLRPTAVKVLTHTPADYDPKTWFLSEARNVARLNHSSVVQIYSVARHGGHRYIAMEYVDGASADVVVARQGPFSPERATAVILQVANALELAHNAGIIHRDVKPANILIKSDGTAKLGDFGMAISAVRASQETARAGTPHYFAPEIWRGEPSSVASDLYALGATYYHLLSGRPPFMAPTLAELMTVHQQHEIPPLTLPPAVAAACMRLVQRCMARSPADRPRSAQEVAWEARGILRDLESIARGEVPARRSRSREMRAFTLPPADATWQAAGFQHEPFGALDGGEPPYRGAPFDGAKRRLLARLAGGGAVLLAGAGGSGRTTLARSALAAWAGPRALLTLDTFDERSDSLIERVARAFGAVASSAIGGAAIEELLDLFGPAVAAGQGPLAVIDGVRPGSRAAAELAQLARAARHTRCFSLLVTGDAALAGPLLEDEADEATVELSPLPMSQVHRYLTAWLSSCRHPEAPPLVISVDAALLLGVSASGNLTQLNELARSAVLAHPAGVLTSWDAWRCTGEGPLEAEAARPVPGQWPTAEVLTLLNHVRRVARLGERGAPLHPGPD